MRNCVTEIPFRSAGPSMKDEAVYFHKIKMEKNEIKVTMIHYSTEIPEPVLFQSSVYLNSINDKAETLYIILSFKKR